MERKWVKSAARRLVAAGCLLLAATWPGMAADNATTNDVPAWVTRPLSLQEAIEIALRQNANILRSKADIEANQGVVLQTRAILFPTLRNTGSFSARDPG